MTFVRYFLVLICVCLLPACGQDDGGSSRGVDFGKVGIFGKTTDTGPGFFVNIRAEYIYRETGEPFVIEWVQACGAKITTTSYAGRSVLLKLFPTRYFVPAPDGKGAIQISGVIACSDKELETDFNEDVLPRIIWHDDINFLGFGWGYVTEDAYNSPLSKLTPVKTTVTKTTRKEWKKWRRRAKKEYVQIGGMPGPWGFSSDDPDREVLRKMRDRNNGFSMNIRCIGYVHIALPDDLMNELTALWPEEIGRYWARRQIVEGASEERLEKIDRLYLDAKKIYLAAKFPGGHREHAYYGGLTGLYTLRGPEGKGLASAYRQRKRLKMAETYPLFPDSLTLPNGRAIEDPQPLYKKNIKMTEEWKGFHACGNAGAVDFTWIKPFPGPDRNYQRYLVDPERNEKPLEIQINGNPVVRIVGQSHGRVIFDKAGYALVADSN